jgi:hypothetical protein
VWLASEWEATATASLPGSRRQLCADVVLLLLPVVAEVGHTLGLMHDGDATSAYFTGQGDFASIMGVGE